MLPLQTIQVSHRTIKLVQSNLVKKPLEFQHQNNIITIEANPLMAEIQNTKKKCFDDLGTENNLKYYGNECNVMAEILLSRYDIFTSKKIQTRTITNLSPSEIENIYGNRCHYRLFEMINLSEFERSINDKRVS